MDLENFEFFLWVHDASSDKLMLPPKFAKLVSSREPCVMKLSEVGDGRASLWDVEVVRDRDGGMFLGQGWQRFAHIYGLKRGHIVVFRFDGDAVLTVKIFDLSMCRRHYDDNRSGFVKMELIDFEFFAFVPEPSSDKLTLASNFAELLSKRRPSKLKLREEDAGHTRLWDVEVVFGGDGRISLGRGWERFAHHYDLYGGQFLFFSFDGFKVLTVKVFDGICCRRHYHYDATSTSEDGGSDSSVDPSHSIDDSDGLIERDPFENIVFAQRLELSDDEVARLVDLVPPSGGYIGFPFVTRLTSTNLTKKNVMKLPQKIATSVDIPAEGTIGLCLSLGAVTEVEYNTDTDCRIVFNKTGWKKFSSEHNLQVGQAVLLTPRKIAHNNLAMGLTIDLIN